MRLYNTLTRREEEFAPARDNTVRMYACGLTVYSRGHIGNFRMFVVVDLLRRALKYEGGYGVRGVMNYTDVDDRTILESQKAGQPLREYTTQFVTAFEKDAAALGLEPVEENPRATDPENIEAMGETIKALERNGHTYRSDGSIYFRICDAARLRQARASRSRRDEERRPRRLGQVRQGRRARLRPVEGDEAGRADVGPGHRSRTAGMAHRVFRDGAAAAGACRRSTSTPAAST